VSPNENEDRPVHESDALLPVQIHGEIDATYHRLPLRTVKQVFVEVITNQEMNKKTKNKVPVLDQVIYFNVSNFTSMIYFRLPMIIHIEELKRPFFQLVHRFQK
jgi:hypothetical protein